MLDNCNCLLINSSSAFRTLRPVLYRGCQSVNILLPFLKNYTDCRFIFFTHRIKYKVILMTFKAIYGICLDYTCDLITPYIPSRSLRSSSQNLLSMKNTRTKTFGARMFSCAAPLLWNALPSKLCSQENIDLFKSQLKTYLFNNAY